MEEEVPVTSTRAAGILRCCVEATSEAVLIAVLGENLSTRSTLWLCLLIHHSVLSSLLTLDACHVFEHAQFEMIKINACGVNIRWPGISHDAAVHCQASGG